MDGERIWTRDLQNDYGTFGHQWGYASSPLFYNNSLFIEVLHGSHTDDPSYIVALNTQNGKTLWHHERYTDAPEESPDAYTTPFRGIKMRTRKWPDGADGKFAQVEDALNALIVRGNGKEDRDKMIAAVWRYKYGYREIKELEESKVSIFVGSWGS